MMNKSALELYSLGMAWLSQNQRKYDYPNLHNVELNILWWKEWGGKGH